MGILDSLRRYLVGTAPNGQPVQYRHFDPPPVIDVAGLGVEQLWRTQPYLRTVVTFLARNIAQLGLHSFERVSDTDRRRVHDDPLPRLLASPNGRMTSFELVFSLVADLALYDEAVWWVMPDADRESGWRLEPIPPAWITARGGGTVFEVAWYEILPPGGQKAQRVKAEEFLTFRGWNPDDLAYGSSPVAALKQILAEQIHAQAYRQQVWERGGRVGTVLERPAGSPQWSEEARKRFKADWRARWAGDSGPDAGGTPILEDGMTLNRVGFSAHEEEWVDAAKLSLSMVASAYHVNPTMVGVLDNANYSNVKEFRRMLYGDTLGPTMAMIEDRLNTFLAPKVSERSGLYVEFNIDEKLQGSFEEQASALQSSVGRPWMTADEARALRNMPALGGDAQALVTPLNVLVGGQASPTDSGSQNRTGRSARAAQVKSRPPDTYEAKYTQVLAAFFGRQAKAVRSRLGAKADEDWWDADRWDRELSDDLFALAVQMSKTVAESVLESIGFGPDAYDSDRTLEFLRALSDRQAGSVNKVTKAQIDEALGSDDPAEAVRHTFEVAETSRAAQVAATTITAVSGFATTEAAKQAAGEEVTKTWNVTSTNPRASHARMNGETVPIDEPFSNGAMWPADAGLDIDEIAGCRCDVTINVP